MKTLLSALLFAAAAPLLSGCAVVLLAGMAGMAAMNSNSNPDPVIFENGVGIRVYTISHERCWGSIEAALKGMSATVTPADAEEGTKILRGTLADGRAVEVKAIATNLTTQVEVKVGEGGSDGERAAARDIHEKFDADVEIVRRHYAEPFAPVWDASQKAELEVQQKLQPNDQIGRIAGRLPDGTPVIITLQLVSESRTRVTVEVGAKPTPEAIKQATQLAEQISKVLGIQAEEEKR